MSGAYTIHLLPVRAGIVQHLCTGELKGWAVAALPDGQSTSSANIEAQAQVVRSGTDREPRPPMAESAFANFRSKLLEQLGFRMVGH